MPPVRSGRTLPGLPAPHPREPPHVTDADAPTTGILAELHRIWVQATEDSITADLQRAAALAEDAPDDLKEEAARYLQALWRLERWLHDR